MGELYIASSLLNTKRVQVLRDRFAALGARLTYDWTVHGYVDDTARLSIIAQQEVSGVRAAHCLLLVTPAREGSHFELGLAFGLNIPIIILDEVPSPRRICFHSLPNLIQCTTAESAIEAVLEVLRGSDRAQKERD